MLIRSLLDPIGASEDVTRGLSRAHRLCMCSASSGGRLQEAKLLKRRCVETVEKGAVARRIGLVATELGEIERLDEPRLYETAKDYSQKSPVHRITGLVSVPFFSAIYECGVNLWALRRVRSSLSSSSTCAKASRKRMLTNILSLPSSSACPWEPLRCIYIFPS